MKFGDMLWEVGSGSSDNGWHDRWNKMVDFASTDELNEHIITKVALVTSELSEAIEELRKGHRYDYVYTIGSKPEGFPVELADATIRILDLAFMLEIDLEEVILDKLKFNQTRGKMHGKTV